ncbi:MFS transporter [Kribbella sp. VKM Ac-2566]|uniref:MFS family arabinose efflux permease n=1 Tax=Kribbella pratensis TaxID=2512112 RepID=A0ABY2FGG3_9ACTN|nr:MFS transporter [Kribbella sp. VKM Ac-2566]TDW90188.1 putative MFS family arabinose efflux permease [Kribbella pratensis]TDW97910.1 putative MFS family arabinose efflux permease [Kribbella sp. VKM Ac-2566]
MTRPAHPSSADPADQPATYGEVFGVAEFRWLWFAQLGSVIGDQLARVALAVLVFDRTGSAGLSAVTYALTFLPDIAGGPLLSGLADRYPRRRLMIGCDVARAVLVAAMAIPGASLWILCVLLVAVQLLASPFQSARAALLPSILTGDKYVLASSVSNITAQASQLAGFVTGGTLVAAFGAGNALLADAVTFALSAVLLRLGVRERPLPESTDARPGWWPSLSAGARLVWSDRRLRYLVALACVAGFYVSIEGLAAPYAAVVGGGPAAVGILLAANPAGQMVGMLLLTRAAPARRLTLMGPLAIGSCAPLIGCVAEPGLWVTVALWFVSGLCASYQLAASAAFVLNVPDAQRGQAFGLARTALIVSQGIGVLVAGAAADRWEPALVVAAAGILGVLVAAGAAYGYVGATRQPA